MIAATMAGFEKQDESPHRFLPEMLTERATCDLAEGRARQAADELARALELEEATHAMSVDVGGTRWPFARALWSLGQRAEAVAAAEKAEEELGADADGAHDRAAVHAWLAAHVPSKPAQDH